VHNEELHYLRSSPNVIREIKSGLCYVAGHVARIRIMRTATEFWSENMKGRDHLGDLGVDGRITF